MKKIFSILAVTFLISLAAEAQMTLEHTYPNSSRAVLVDLAISGKKYAIVDADNDQVRLYNLDHSLWKTVNFPAIAGFNPIEAFYFSENLFKMDNKVDMAVLYGSTFINFGKCVIIDEDGNIINQVDNAGYITVYNSGNDTFKAVIAGTNEYFVYSLPGTIPCNSCGNGLGLGKEPAYQNTGYISDPIPNPSSNNSTIEYTLPFGVPRGEVKFYNANGQLVQTYTVSNSANRLIINSTDISPGTYYYNLSTGREQCQTMKMIIVK